MPGLLGVERYHVSKGSLVARLEKTKPKQLFCSVRDMCHSIDDLPFFNNEQNLNAPESNSIKEKIAVTLG